MNDTSPNPPPSRGVPATTLILAIATTAAITVSVVMAVVMAVVYFTSARPGAPAAPGQPSVVAALTGTAPMPSVQKDTVKPQGRAAGEVFYEYPYGAPPHLTLSAPHRIYRIVKQDEFGFAWEADSIAEDFVGDVKEIAAALQNGRLDQLAKKPGVEYEDFTYEARGVPPDPAWIFSGRLKRRARSIVFSSRKARWLSRRPSPRRRTWS